MNIVPVYEHLDDGAKLSPVYNVKKIINPPVIVTLMCNDTLTT